MYCIVAGGQSIAAETRGVGGEAGEGEGEGGLVVGVESPANDASNVGLGDTDMGRKGGEETEIIRKTAKKTNPDPKSRLRQGWIIRYQIIRRERLHSTRRARTWGVHPGQLAVGGWVTCWRSV